MKILFQTLLVECFHNNQAFIKEFPDGKIAPILERIPCYECGDIV